MDISDTEESVSISQEARRKTGGGLEKQYYSTPGCEGLLQQLLHLLRFGEGLPVVQAGRSAGKTAMSNSLRNRLNECSWLAQVQCDYDQDIAELLEQIVLGFGLQAGPGAGESLAALRHFSTQLANNKELGILILDDAHLLDNQALGAVLSLLQGNNLPGYGLHMVFFCAPGLVERIDEIGLLDAPVYDFEIPLFSPSELSGFLKSRFPPVISGKLSAGLVQNIWSQSMGSPGVALAIVGKSDLASQDQGNVRTGLAFLNSMPKGHLIALFVLVAVLLWAAFARESLVPSEGKEPVVIEKPSAQVELANQNNNALSTENTNGAAFVSEGQQEEISALEADEVELQTGEFASQLDTGRDERLVNEGLTNESLDKERLPNRPFAKNDGNELQDNLQTTKEFASPESSQELTQQLKAPQTATQQTVRQEPGTTVAPANSPVRDMAGKAAPGRPLGMSAHELFLMDQSPETYTLQIIAASRKDALQKYMSAQANKNDLYLYQGLREGKAWFVVVTGIFTTRQEALQAVNDLPPEQKKGGPWPRQLSSIQSEIAVNRSR